MLCRHCHLTRVSRPRGLCWSCFYSPGVRERYPPARCFEPSRRRRPADAPTQALPGSLEKIRILAERWASNQELFHPEDVTLFANALALAS